MMQALPQALATRPGSASRTRSGGRQGSRTPSSPSPGTSPAAPSTNTSSPGITSAGARISASWPSSASAPRATACRGTASSRRRTAGIGTSPTAPSGGCSSSASSRSSISSITACRHGSRAPICNPDYPELVAEYAGRLAERFRGRIFWYTPLNEPRITAWYCGRLGWWPPFRRGWRGFVAVMLGVCRGIVRTVEALARGRSRDRGGPCRRDRSVRDRRSGARRRGARGGRRSCSWRSTSSAGGSTRGIALRAWLIEQGATEADLAWFREHAVDLPVIGMNLYPMFTQKRLLRDAAGRLRIRMPYASARPRRRGSGGSIIERYGVPLFISETASLGSVARRRAWLDDSVAASRALRAGGRPAVRLHVVADVRARRLGLSPGPAAACRLSRPDGPVGPRSGSRRRPRTGSHAPCRRLPRSRRRRRKSLSAACRKRNRASPRPVRESGIGLRDVSQLLPCRLRGLDGLQPARPMVRSGRRDRARPHRRRRITATSRRSASMPRARRSAGRSSTEAAATISPAVEPFVAAPRGRTASRSSGTCSTTAIRRTSTSGAPLSRSASPIIATRSPAISRREGEARSTSRRSTSRPSWPMRAARRGCSRRTAQERGWELKIALVRAAIAGIDAIRLACPDARIVNVDPLCRVALPGRPARPCRGGARLQRAPRLPGLGHAERPAHAGARRQPRPPRYRRHQLLLDQPVGVAHPAASTGSIPPLADDDPRRLPLRDLVRSVWERYGGEIIITRDEPYRRHARRRGCARSRRNAEALLREGVPLRGVCLYPILGMPEWHDPDIWTPMGSVGPGLPPRAVRRPPRLPADARCAALGAPSRRAAGEAPGGRLRHPPDRRRVSRRRRALT